MKLSVSQSRERKSVRAYYDYEVICRKRKKTIKGELISVSCIHSDKDIFILKKNLRNYSRIALKNILMNFVEFILRNFLTYFLRRFSWIQPQNYCRVWIHNSGRTLARNCCSTNQIITWTMTSDVDLSVDKLPTSLFYLTAVGKTVGLLIIIIKPYIKVVCLHLIT